MKRRRRRRREGGGWVVVPTHTDHHVTMLSYMYVYGNIKTKRNHSFYHLMAPGVYVNIHDFP